MTAGSVEISLTRYWDWDIPMTLYCYQPLLTGGIDNCTNMATIRGRRRDHRQPSLTSANTSQPCVEPRMLHAAHPALALRSEDLHNARGYLTAETCSWQLSAFPLMAATGEISLRHEVQLTIGMRGIQSAPGRSRQRSRAEEWFWRDDGPTLKPVSVNRPKQSRDKIQRSMTCLSIGYRPAHSCTATTPG